MATLNVRFKLRRRTAATWTSTNEVLLEGEMGLETDTRKAKYGDGVTAWNSLSYAAVDLTGALLTSQLDTDGTLAANSDAKVPSQKAVKTYAQPASSVLTFLATASSNTAAAVKTLLALVKGDVGLGNVDNTADTAKPVSTAQQTALDLKANLSGATFTALLANSMATGLVTRFGSLTDTYAANHCYGIEAGAALLMSKMGVANNGNRLFLFYHDATNGGFLLGYNASNVAGFDLRGAGDSYVTANSGNFGIGTASPTAKADINGDTLRLRTAKTPASASAAGNPGDHCWDSGFLYVCTATNTWKRVAIATW